MGSEVKQPGKSLKSWAQRYLNVGFVVGFLLVLLTYLIVSQQFAMSAPNAVNTTAPRIADKEVIKAPSETGTQEDGAAEKMETKPEASDPVGYSNQDEEMNQQSEGERREPEETHQDTSGAVPTKKGETVAKPFENGKVVCNTDGPFSDTCDVDGDVRTNGTALSVTLVPASSSERREWKIRPYSRRTMSGINKVTVTQLASPKDQAAPPPCTVTNNVPAVVFALGGLAGNYWHDFSDVLVPLFVASRQYGGEVQFLVSLQPTVHLPLSLSFSLLLVLSSPLVSSTMASSIQSKLPVELSTISAAQGIQLLSITFVVFVIASKLLFAPKKLGKALPTPGGLPWAGPVWAVEASSIYKTFKQWSEKFGSLYEVTLFGQNLIIISDPSIAREILAKKAKTVSDRPPLALVKGSKDSGKYLPFLGNNDHLTRQRRFGVLINNYTASVNYHGRMLPESTRFAHQLLEKCDSPFMLVDQLCGRLSARMAFGTPAPRAAIARSAHNFMQNLSPGGQITNVLTFLRYLPEFLNSDKHNEAMRVDIEDRVWYGAYDKAKAAHENGTLNPSYAQWYFENEAKSGLTENEALHGIAMMATVSILTLIAPLQRWLVIMAKYPEWQKKVQEELDEQLQGRMADFTDSPKLPVLRATILESVRYASPVPTGIPHRLEEDMEYNGYHLSKDSNVLAVDWTMCRSSNFYEDADSFNPSRWIDPESSLYKEPLTEYPKLQNHSVFGWGRRVCIGQDYAATQMLVVCAAVMYGFNIGPGVDESGKPLDLDIDKLLSTPNVIPIMDPIDIRFTARSETQAQRLREAYRLQKLNDDEKEEYECL